MRDADDVDQAPDPETPSNTSMVSDSHPNPSQQNPEASFTEPPPVNGIPDQTIPLRPTVRPEALNATTYDIVPTTAAPHSTSINAVAATADMRWVFSGGSDGYVRKFNWVDSINSKLMLTVAQRHPFVDSVIKAGVLMTYWDNMDGNDLSPVYSLASHSQGLWILSGLESGTIRLQSVRHDEGKEIALLQQHTSAVSVLSLTPDEHSLLSGGWDKKVFDWDLNVGKSRRTFTSGAGQISSIEIRPESSIPVPHESGDLPTTNGTYSSNNAVHGGSSFGFQDGGGADTQDGSNDAAGSPADSLFGGDSLFGDADGNGEAEVPSGGAFGVDEHDEFSQVIANGIQQSEESKQRSEKSDTQANGVPPPQAPAVTQPESGAPEQPVSNFEKDAANSLSQPLTNGLPHSDDMEKPGTDSFSETTQNAESNIVSDTTFLSSSIDGAIRVWDRRQPDPVSRIPPRNAPPWCMNACWSPDGNYIYAGRRNGTVEEFSLHKGFREAERTFKFPQGSGPVTALKAMPNGKHLIWYVFIPSRHLPKLLYGPVVGLPHAVN